MSKRRRAVGAEPVDDGVRFRVWAPAHESVAVVIEGRTTPLQAEHDGYFAAVVRGAGAGTRYRFRLDGEDGDFPDPASRFQPDGPHGDSVVVDPAAYGWRDASWRGVELRGRVLYEMHVGTFTPEGTWSAASEKLPLLADVGIDTVEILPVNEFPGRFGWGYDGVDLWAPTRLYGTPDDFRAFVDAAHAHGIAVILDVVYNHLGPDGCYLSKFTPGYFTSKYENEWGESLNFDGDDAHGVRTFFAENAAYWIDEFHLDGLRVDATQSMHDASDEHVLALIARCAREAAGTRKVLFIAENEPQDVAMIRRYGLDAIWNDDWHHSLSVALTGRTEAYYTDYRGTAQELVSMARFGFLYQGQRYVWQKQRRGTPALDLPAPHFVCYLQNHDQVANSARGERLPQLTDGGRFRAATALLLLQPQTPMLFQGEEFATSKPFLYFADHHRELAEKVASGRHDFLAQFPSTAADEMREVLARPDAESTFVQCKLDWSEREQHADVVALHRDLLRLRREDATFAAQDATRLHGAVLSDEALALRFVHGGDRDRLLLVNLGRDLALTPAPEPLLAPPAGCTWTLLWSSEWPQYGGNGTAAVEDDDGTWRLPGHAAVVLAAVPTSS